MSDRSQPHANGRSDPADLPAGELASWWDHRVEQRRVAGAEPTSTEQTATVVRQLEALGRADELSSPRPDFLEHLESQLMQTPTAILPGATPSPRPEPLVLPILRGGPPRRSRGLIDVLTVAAVVSLLLGGSWSIWSNQTTAPTPSGFNGGAGVSTPDPNGLDPLVREVTLNQDWAAPVTGSPLNGLAPIPVTDCTTPSRGPDWFTIVSDPAATPLPLASGAPSTELGGVVSPKEMAEYPVASDEDRKTVEAFYHQLVACRNTVEPGTDRDTFLLAGPFWNLLSTDFLIQQSESFGAGDQLVDGPRLQLEARAALGLSVFPADITDVRTLPNNSLDQRQLLVASRWVGSFPSERMTVLVLEDGLWRVGASNVMQYPDGTSKRQIGVASLLNSEWWGGMESSDGRLFSGMPLSITVTNTAYTNLTVSIGGQDVGSLTYGETIYTTPFVVRPESVQAAGGQFPIDVSMVGLNTLLTEPYHLTVEYTDPEVGPMPATPGAGSTPVTPSGTPSTVTPADGVVSLDQPWAEDLPGIDFNGVAPVNTTECTTPSRPASSVEAAIEDRLALGDAAPTIEPEFVPGAGIDPTSFPLGTAADVVAVTSFFQQLSACRFQTGERDGTALVPYTGAYWNLYSADAFGINPDLLRGRTVTEVVREQYSWTSSYVAAWSYPASVIEVRTVPADAQGRPRLLVQTVGAYADEDGQLSLLVQEDGQWRFLAPSLELPEARPDLTAQVADIVIGRDPYGPRGAGNFSSQLEGGFPVAMTIANVGATSQRVMVAGRDLGVVEPGASLVVQPFVVSPEAVVAAGGRLTFTIESVDLGALAGAPTPRPLTIAVYSAGSLPYGPTSNGLGTPAAVSSPEATPAG